MAADGRTCVVHAHNTTQTRVYYYFYYYYYTHDVLGGAAAARIRREVSGRTPRRRSENGEAGKHNVPETTTTTVGPYIFFSGLPILIVGRSRGTVSRRYLRCVTRIMLYRFSFGLGKEKKISSRLTPVVAPRVGPVCTAVSPCTTHYIMIIGELYGQETHRECWRRRERRTDE